MITDDTRKEAHEKVNASENRVRVLGVILSSSVPLGASQIAEALGWDVTSTRPRLTELLKAGQIEAKGKNLLSSGRHEATFAPIKKEVEPAFDENGAGFFKWAM